MFEEVPSKFDFPKTEAEILAFWEKNRIYEKSLEKTRGGKPFIFYEGPPTANGLPHPGHCLTRAMKDLFPRYKTMTGHHCLRKGGWDTHGLPVEVEVCKELGIHTKEEIEAYGIEAFNKKCLESVFRYTKEWEELTRRIGFWVNLDEAYVTYHQSYVESVWWALKTLFDAGLLYQGHKIVWWWAQGGTALSAGEVGQGYREVADPSVFVRFPLVMDDRARKWIADCGLRIADCEMPNPEEPRASARAAAGTVDGANPRIGFLVWTTTPWTLPSNMFAAVHPDFDYALVYDEVEGERLIFAKALVEPVAKKLKATERWKIERTFKGSELDGLRYVPPYPECYYNRPAREFAGIETNEILGNYEEATWKPPNSKRHIAWRILRAGFVTLDSGTGLVHEAPAFGEVDFELWEEQWWEYEFCEPEPWPLLCAVGPDGKFTSHAGPKYEGRWVKDCDKDLIRDLKEREAHPGSGIPLLLHQEQYRHDYPFCWRAEEDPLIQYPRRSWFIRTTRFKDEMLANNREINWLPEHIKAGRFGKFLESNVDWSLSRERYWGTPLPIWVCQNASCGHTEAIDSYEMLVAKPGVEGLEVWEKAKAENPELVEDLKVHKPYIDAITYQCPKCAPNQSPERKRRISDQSRDRKGAVLADDQEPLPDGRGSEEPPRMQRVPEVIDCWFDSGAMPFAQWGYPHQNVEMFNSQFPAHFISEALDQTRGWFYSLTAISVMLFGRNGVAREQLESRGATGKLRLPVASAGEAARAEAHGSSTRSGGLGDREAARAEARGSSTLSGELGDREAARAEARGSSTLSGELGDREAARAEAHGSSTSVVRSAGGGLLAPAADYPHPFETCIVLGLLMGEDGQKMSKSKQNYKDPTYIFNHEGADAMRWLFFSGQTPWTSIRFQESAIADGQREFLIRLYNCYSFFVIYANIDKWTPEFVAPASRRCSITGGTPVPQDPRTPDQRPAADARTELDRWIISELNDCCLRVYQLMEKYDNFYAAKALIEFVDALSNWYVRRNRDRFWRPGMDDDKKAAYATLHRCLVTVSKLIAPFTPFIAESQYRNLVRTHDAEAPQSVHLCDYPITQANKDDIESGIDHDLNAQVDGVRQLVSCGRAARNAAGGIRVRQPLAAIELYHRQADVIRTHEDIVKDELNVKRIDYVSAAEIDKYVHYEIKPDFKKIGPKHGPLAPKIKAALAEHADVEGVIKAIEQDGKCAIDVAGQTVELAADEVAVELHAKEGYTAERIPGAGILVLDTHVTPELRDEGIARDLIHHIQQARKGLDLRYEQRINLAIVGDADIQRVLGDFGKYVMGETLAQTILSQAIPEVEPVKTKIEGREVAIYVRPI